MNLYSYDSSTTYGPTITFTVTASTSTTTTISADVTPTLKELGLVLAPIRVRPRRPAVPAPAYVPPHAPLTAGQSRHLRRWSGTTYVKQSRRRTA